LEFVIAFVLGAFATPSAQAQTFTVLYSFTGSPDGANPFDALLRDAEGNLYGTTGYGGDGTCSPGCGTVFKVSESGSETVLYNFGGAPDGAYPEAELVRDASGNLYGTTGYGGNGTCSGGCGTVFKVSKSGTETVLYSFAGSADGSSPDSGLVRDAKGNLYGTTYEGGASNYGVVFKLSKTGTLTVLHTFTGGSDGAYPYAGLLRDASGNLYGTAAQGGASNYGVVFKLSKTGTLTVLHTFTGDGAYPHAGLVRDAKGNLYGDTARGGASNQGVVFKLRNRILTVLHSFAGGTTDGCFAYGTPSMDKQGNLYGTTDECGSSGYGTVWKVSQKGDGTVLHSFAGSDGEYPVAGVIRDAKGNLYGTAYEGGGSGYGAVWELTP